MSRVFLIQLLCPNRHAIIAHAHESATEELNETAEAAMKLGVANQIDQWIRQHKCNPWCGLCGATRDTWTLETGKTKYATLAEALPDIRRLEAENAASAQCIKAQQRKATHN